LVAVVDKHGAAHILDVASKQFVQIGGEVSKKKIAQGKTFNTKIKESPTLALIQLYLQLLRVPTTWLY
jgi:hypothetical protein